MNNHDLSVKKWVDTGMAVTLLGLIVFHVSDNKTFATVAMVLLVVNMVIPKLYAPVANVWFGLSALMGGVMSKLILSFVFFLIVTPFGLVRQWAGVDTLSLRKWKTGPQSAFINRETLFTAENLEKPY